METSHSQTSQTAEKSNEKENTVTVDTVMGPSTRSQVFSSGEDGEEVVFSNHLLIEGIYSLLDFESRRSLTQVNWACMDAQHAKFLRQYSIKPPPFTTFNQLKKFIAVHSGLKMLLRRTPEVKFRRGGALTLDGVLKLEIRNPASRTCRSENGAPAKFVKFVLRIFPNLREILQTVPFREPSQNRHDRAEMVRIAGALLDALATKPESTLRKLRVGIDGDQISRIANLAVNLEHLELTNVNNEEGWSVEEWQALRTALLRHAGTLEVLKLPVVLDWNIQEIALDFPPLPELKVLQLDFLRKNLRSGYDMGLYPPLSFPRLQNKLSYSTHFPNLEELDISAWKLDEETGGAWIQDILRTFFPEKVQDSGQRKLRCLKVDTDGYLQKLVPFTIDTAKANEIREREKRKRQLVKCIHKSFPDLQKSKWSIILDGKHKI